MPKKKMWANFEENYRTFFSWVWDPGPGVKKLKKAPDPGSRIRNTAFIFDICSISALGENATAKLYAIPYSLQVGT
jgi:hypothetical protein